MSKRSADDMSVSPPTNQSRTKKMDTKLSPGKEPVLDPERQETIRKIEENAPEWFSHAFNFIVNEFHRLRTDSMAVKSSQLLSDEKITKLEAKIQKLETITEAQNKTITSLNRKITSFETYSRRDNLLIDGLSESRGEDIKRKVLTFFEDTLKVNSGKQISLTRVHRIGRIQGNQWQGNTPPRTVIVRFHYYPDREKVWRASWKLKDNMHFVKEDFPESVIQNRRILLPPFRAARKDPSVKKALLRGDVLIIDDKHYTVDTLSTLPDRLKWTEKGERFIEECNSTFFFGKESFLSNHHPSKFVEAGKTYLCVEEYYLEKKPQPVPSELYNDLEQ